MSSSQGQATWRAMRSSSGQASASQSHQIQPPAPPQPPPAPASAPPAAAVPFPPGYPNAPPVQQLPPGINQQQWNQGYWRFDPKPGWTSASTQAASAPVVYNPGLVNNNNNNNNNSNRGQSQPPPPPAWVPHPHWQFPADFNPYKRVPKPPDPSYWATELSDNPLGLENMHITKQFIEEHDGHTMQTPWVWTSSSLPEGESPREATDVQDNKEARSRHRLTSASEQVEQRRSRDPHPQPNQDGGDSYRQRGHTSSHSRSRGQSRQDQLQPAQPPPVPPIPNQNQRTPPQPSVTPERHSSLSRRHTYDHTPPGAPPPLSSSRRESSTSHDDLSRRQLRSSPEQNADRPRGDEGVEAFSRRRELHPTFSPAIVRTPKYYSDRAITPVSTPTRPTSNASIRRSSEPTLQNSQSRSAIPPPLVSYLTESASGVLSPLIGATPRPSSTSIPGEKIYKEPTSSPVDSGSQHRSHPQSTIHSSSHSHHSRAVSRSHTYPTLDPVSEDPFSGTPRDVQSARNFPLTSSRKSENESMNSRTLPRSYTFPDTLSTGRALSPTHNTTPSRPSSRNPSRPPSRPSSRPQSPSNSSLILPPPPEFLARMQENHPNAVPAPIQVRKGYWNRRGDHLTESGYIVYVPEDKAFPSDLIHYPIEEFMNPDGEKIQYNSQEELLDSLPRFGKPPRQPYESFVQYERRWRPLNPITPP